MDVSSQVAVIGTMFQAMSAWEISKIYRVSREEAMDLGIGAIIEGNHSIYGSRTAAVRAALIREIVTANAVVVLFFGLLVQSLSYSAPLAFASPVNGEYFSMLMIVLFAVYIFASSRLIRVRLRARVATDLRDALAAQSQTTNFSHEAFFAGVAWEISQLLDTPLDEPALRALVGMPPKSLQ